MLLEISKEYFKLRNQLYTFGLLFVSVKYLPFVKLSAFGGEVNLQNKVVVEGALTGLVGVTLIAMIPYVLKDIFRPESDTPPLPVQEFYASLRTASVEAPRLTFRRRIYYIICLIVMVVEIVAPLSFGMLILIKGFSSIWSFISVL